MPSCQGLLVFVWPWLGRGNELSWFNFALVVADAKECAFSAPNAESVSFYEDVMDVYLELAAFPARRERIVCIFFVLEGSDRAISSRLQTLVLAYFL